MAVSAVVVVTSAHVTLLSVDVSITYPVIGFPPVIVGAVHEAVAVQLGVPVLVILRSMGPEGVDDGTAEMVAGDPPAMATPPACVSGVTRNQISVPFVRPYAV